MSEIRHDTAPMLPVWYYTKSLRERAELAGVIDDSVPPRIADEVDFVFSAIITIVEQNGYDRDFGEFILKEYMYAYGHLERPNA